MRDKCTRGLWASLAWCQRVLLNNWESLRHFILSQGKYIILIRARVLNVLQTSTSVRSLRSSVVRKPSARTEGESSSASVSEAIAK